MQLNSTRVATHCIKKSTVGFYIIYSKLTSNEIIISINHSNYHIATNLDHYKI